MFPGFVNIFKDTDGYVHLYFFSGIRDNDEPIYKDIDLKNIPFKHRCLLSTKYTKEYKFINKTIISIKCKLVDNETGEIEIKNLTLEN